MTTRPCSRCLVARRRMDGSAVGRLSTPPRPPRTTPTHRGPFDAHFFDRSDSVGEEGRLVGVDAEAARFRQRLSAKLEQDPFVFGGRHMNLRFPSDNNNGQLLARYCSIV